MAYFCVALSFRVGYKTLKVHLSGLQFWGKMQWPTVAISTIPRLPYVLRGIRRQQGNTHLRPPRLPISLAQLRQIVHYITIHYSTFDSAMLTAATLMAFFGMLRVSEYTAPAASVFDPMWHLTVQDVCVNWHRKIALSI